MTLVALWHRRDRNDIYAIADSRLVGGSGTLTDQAPKFTTARVVCFKLDGKGKFDQKILDRQIAIGYAGSAAAAFATIATLQSYLSSLTLKEHGSTPTLGQVSDLAKRILDQNFREFGKLWQNEARCDLVFFGYLPTDRQLKCFHVGSNLVDNKIITESNELHLVRDGLCASFGSCSNYFMAQLKADMDSTGNFHPFNILGQIIDSGDRSDVGGYVQVAIASKSDVVLPHVLKPRPELGEHAADVTFLGRDVSEIGGVGDCSIGKEAVGPDRTAPAKILSDAKKHPS